TLEISIYYNDQGLGFLWLVGSGPSPSDLLVSLGEELGMRIAIAIGAARAIAREHHIAETLQRALLPERLPRNCAFALDAAYRPAAGESIVGGDWYDAFELGDGRIALSIGDVAGHGLSAAVVMSEARQAVRASAFDAKAPGEVLSRANQMLRGAPMMVTALVGIFDPASSSFTYASAGHPSPLVVTPDYNTFMLPNGDLPLAVLDDIAPSEWTFTLQPGSLLVMYTDGLVEYGRDVFAGESSLAQAAVAEVRSPSEHPAKRLQDYVLGRLANRDDIATMTVFVEPRPQEEFNCTFSAVPFSAPFVRRGLERFLREKGIDEDRRFSIITAVGEAVANAVEHAYVKTPGTVSLSARLEASVLRVHIEDCGNWRPASKRENRGRGIPLMRALMDRVEIRTERASTQVRMQLEIA
ncbi:MAG: ATP-binding SpoIIE family protein phosphatase, partial [Polyangiaceae bacterium]